MRTPAQVLQERAEQQQLRQLALDNNEPLNPADHPYGLACPPEEDQTRQEFAAAADINNIFDRYTITQIPQRQVIYTERDFDMDLAEGLNAVATAKRIYARMPTDLRKDYPNWQTLMHAMNNGEARLKIGERPQPTPTPAPTPAQPPS